MPKFMDVKRGMTGITAEELDEVHRADRAAEHAEGVHFEHVWADPRSGTVFCLSEAPSEEAVRRAHERAGHPVDEIHPVSLSV